MDRRVRRPHEPLTKRSGELLRGGEGSDERDGASTTATSQLRRRFELEQEHELATTEGRAEPEPGFLAEEPEDGVPTPRPKMPLSCVPRRVMAERELLALPLDHRAGFVLAHADGATNIRTLIDLCGMPQNELVALIEQLLALRVIELIY